MSFPRKLTTISKPTSSEVYGTFGRCRTGLRSNLADNITPLHAFLVIFYALWVVGGLLQTDFSRSGKLTSPHSHDSGLAEVSETEAESKIDVELCTLTPTWSTPCYKVSATPVISDRQPAVCIQFHTVSLRRGPPVA
ncbi:hypothetical protein ACYFX5_06910 [Bremerella sp. T1]|uniref:hypothetical protein n=1 Tax=Bremerella sp. TYQ1 TaxID=3119568 RepID=UPI001CCC51EE|nr:hypothetical protein [Bremerella volcania]UBM37986.1 hypothetical protein LA756_08845 [Bremerella volcania]